MYCIYQIYTYMNVVILTPDRVGSTLLQRVFTIHMIESNFNKPVINLHELTNGIISMHPKKIIAVEKDKKVDRFRRLGHSSCPSRMQLPVSRSKSLPYVYLLTIRQRQRWPAVGRPAQVLSKPGNPIC